MNKPKEERRQIHRALTLFEKGAVTDAVVLLTRYQARTELQLLISSSKLDTATLRALEDQTSATAIAAYILLKDEKRLMELADRFLSQGRYSQAVDALLNVQVLPGKHSECLMQLFQKGAHKEALRLLKFVYPESQLELLVKVEGGTQYTQFRQLIKNNLMSCFEDQQSNGMTLHQDVANQLALLEYTRDTELVREFESQCLVAGKKEWAYAAASSLMRIARKGTEDKPASFTKKIEAVKLAIEQGKWLVASEMLMAVLEQHDVPEETRTLFKKMFAQIPLDDRTGE